MIYTRQMMKPGESFVLIRTNEIFTVGPWAGSVVFNETRKKWTKLHGNCHVMPIKKKESK